MSQVVPAHEDDGYVSPDFDLGSDSDFSQDEERYSPPAKRSRTKHEQEVRPFEEDEELALRILGAS